VVTAMVMAVVALVVMFLFSQFTVSADTRSFGT
jgi:hypothetical protein